MQRGVNERIEVSPANSSAVMALQRRLSERVRGVARIQNAEDARGAGDRSTSISLDTPRLRDGKEVTRLAQTIRGYESEMASSSMGSVLRERSDGASATGRDYMMGDTAGVPHGILPADMDAVFTWVRASQILKGVASAQTTEQFVEDLCRLDAYPFGVPLVLLRLQEDRQFLELAREVWSLQRDHCSSERMLRSAVESVDAYVMEMARKEVTGRRDMYLRPNPLGVPLSGLPIDTDTVFRALEVSRATQKLQGSSEEALAEVSDHLNRRAEELAKEQLTEDLRGVYPTPCGIPLELLSPHDDDRFAQMVRDIRNMKRSRDTDGIRKRLLEMSERAEDLARKVADRRFLDPEPEGVPLFLLPLDTDVAFSRLEAERATLKLKDAVLNAAGIITAEVQLNARAHELARMQLIEDLSGVDASPCGLPLVLLRPHDDPQFKSLVDRMRSLKMQRHGDDNEVQSVVEQMSMRACAMTREVLQGERASYLKSSPLGVPLGDLDIDADEAFTNLELTRAVQLLNGATRAGVAIASIEAKLNRRLVVIARAQLAVDLCGVNPTACGVPLELLRVNEDAELRSLIEEVRRRKKRKETEDIQRLLEAMNERAVTLAKCMMDGAYLDQDPEGVPLHVLSLNTDTIFRHLESERATLKLRGSECDAASLAAVEAALNSRAHELAKEQLVEDLRGVDAAPMGLPLVLLKPYEDIQLCNLVDDVRLLKRDWRSRKPEIEVIIAKMNARVKEMVCGLLHGDRARYLPAAPLGVPLSELPLDTDDTYSSLELSRATHALRGVSGKAMEEIERRLGQRAGELAREQLVEDLRGVDAAPRGLPLKLLQPHKDPQFLLLIKSARSLKKDLPGSEATVRARVAEMNARASEMADTAIQGDRHSYLAESPLGVPLSDLPLDIDETFKTLELTRATQRLRGVTGAALHGIDAQLNTRAEQLAKVVLQKDFGGLPAAPLGVPIALLNLHAESCFDSAIPQLRQLSRDRATNRGQIESIWLSLHDHIIKLAERYIEDDRARYLDGEHFGVPWKCLALSDIATFGELEAKKFFLTANDPEGKREAIQKIEEQLKDMAKRTAEKHLRDNCGHLSHRTSGVALARSPRCTDLQSDRSEGAQAVMKTDDGDHGEQRNALEVERSEAAALEGQGADMDDTARGLALQEPEWSDAQFDAENEHIAKKWLRVTEVYPEGNRLALEPPDPSCADVTSATGGVSHMAPFLAALSVHAQLLQRLIVSKKVPVNGAYIFVFFDPNSTPVRVEVDDRVPCTESSEPKFTHSPTRAWWPLLLEKAYAKFVGGYEQLGKRTPHETLRDLTGRPVTHTLFDAELTEMTKIGDFTTVLFWRGVATGMARGDVVLCLSNPPQKDTYGIRPQSSYALLEVIDTVRGSSDPHNVVIMLHNSQVLNGFSYTGPLSHGHPMWTEKLMRACRYDPMRSDHFYMPLPTFLACFSSIQWCHVNCGDRLTAAGSWAKETSGGGPQLTTFRNNPIFLVENASAHPAEIYTEIRHVAPFVVDKEGLRHYPEVGVALMQPLSSLAAETPLVTRSTHRFLQKGIPLDSREVCTAMELPPGSTCCLIPYTMQSGQVGDFSLSIYAGVAKVTLRPVNFSCLSRTPAVARVTLHPGQEGRRVDFLLSAGCDVHVLLRQEKVSDQKRLRKGDVAADDDVAMIAFNEQGLRCGSSGDPTNAREHSMVLRAPQAGRYSLLLTSPRASATGDCPCTLSIITTKRISVRFVPPPADTRKLQPALLPGTSKAGFNIRCRSSVAVPDDSGAKWVSVEMSAGALPQADNVRPPRTYSGRY